MCETCGCGDPALVPVDVHDRILAGNDAQARHNREHFAERGVTAVNVMGSPGAGKTALLEATAGVIGGRRIGALAGDLATDRDAERLAAAGIPALSITTGNACHLDAQMVHQALHRFSWSHLEFLFIENVGNLVCPAVYDLGQIANVVVLSVTEGEDKPLKYPVMFRTADLVVLTKIDLLPHLRVSVAAIEDALAHVMPSPALLKVSAATGEGIDRWLAWLERQRHQHGRHAQCRMPDAECGVSNVGPVGRGDVRRLGPDVRASAFDSRHPTFTWCTPDPTPPRAR